MSGFPDISLELVDLGCDRGGLAIIRQAGLKLLSGEALQLFGDNGSGKSTFLQVLAGLAQPTQGNIRWSIDGQTVSPEEIRTQTVFAGHQLALKPMLSVKENLSFWCELYQKPRTVQENALNRMGIGGFRDSLVGNLSAGQQRRVSMARCLLAGRVIWFLDEPAASLDQSGHGLIGTLIKEHLAAGGMAVIATHSLFDIPSTNLRLSVMESD